MWTYELIDKQVVYETTDMLDLIIDRYWAQCVVTPQSIIGFDGLNMFDLEIVEKDSSFFISKMMERHTCGKVNWTMYKDVVFGVRVYTHTYIPGGHIEIFIKEKLNEKQLDV